MIRNLLRALLAVLVLAACGLTSQSALAQATACSGAGCVTAGPRLASVNSAQGALLNGVLGSLAGTGSNLTVSALDWQSVATGNINLSRLLGSVQTSLGLATPTQALNTQVNVGTLVSLLASTASSQGNTTLAAALNNVSVPLSLTSGTIAIGELVKTDAGLGNTSLNALELVTGAVQLLNSKNLATTPQAVTLSGSTLGLSGVGNVSLLAQVIEPPVFICGTVGSTFHTASVRIKLNLSLLNTSADTGLLSTVLNILSTKVTLVNLDLYVELAKATGVITQLNALAGSMSVQATPGVANLYLGLISDSVFFNRSRGVSTAIASSDIGYATVGSVLMNGTTLLDLGLRASALGSASSPSTLTFTGATSTTQTASTGVAFAGNLLATLVGNLQIRITPAIPLVTDLLQVLLQGVVQTLVNGVITPLLTGLLDPLLQLLGIGLGEVDVNGAGAYYLCSISGSVYNDLNHNLRNDTGEAGLATPMYAKLVATNTLTGPSTIEAVVDQTTGAYSFANVSSQSYSIVVNATSGIAAVTPAAASGWMPTEQPTMTRSVTVAGTQVSGLNFGFWRGSKLSGIVFKDTGIGTGGIANNVVRDGAETAVQAGVVKVTDTTGATAYDTTSTDANGAYTLWIPFAAGASPLKITQVPGANWAATGGTVGTTLGTYTVATNTVAFTNVMASTYTGVNFAIVPANRFDTDGQQTAAPGTDVFYAHQFVAGTAGALSFASSTPVANGWSMLPYLDANCDGKLQSSETLITAAQPVVADQKICIVVKVFVPAAAPVNSRYPMVLTAHFAYANNVLQADLLRTDLTVVGNASEAGLLLTKTVDKATAAVGDTLVYTITYLNQSGAALKSLNVYDATPAYTVFTSAACGAVPTGVVCSVAAKPTAGAIGGIQWAFTGDLPSGASGQVILRVQVQ